MEDVLVLDGILNQFPDDRLAAFEHYSEYRHPDAHAICDLALYNYIEVRMALLCNKKWSGQIASGRLDVPVTCVTQMCELASCLPSSRSRSFQMRDLVAKPSFLLRKRFDNFLHWLFPKLWVPLYTSVTFTRMRYHLCIANRAWQDKVSVGGRWVHAHERGNNWPFLSLQIVDKMIIVGKAAVAMTAVFILIRATQRHPQLLTRLQDRLHLIWKPWLMYWTLSTFMRR